MPHLSHSKPKLAWRKLAPFAGVAGLIGIVAVVLVSAAGTPIAFETETGTLAAGAAVTSVTGQSGSGAVKFATGSPTPVAAACAPYPAFPDASCTGPTGVLTEYTGPDIITTPNQVIQNVIIHSGGMRVEANNVTFRNCRIIYEGALDGGFALIYLPAGVTGTTFDHCEIDGQDKIARAIEGIDGVTVTSCNIHNSGNGIEVNTNITMTETYMHDIFTPAGLDWHADGIQPGDSAENITIEHNTILLTGGETGAINIVSNGGVGTFTNVLVEHNLMAGGGYTVYAGSAPAKTINFKVVNNHFSKRYFPKVGQYNIWYETYTANVVRTGNVIDETGVAANGNL